MVVQGVVRFWSDEVGWGVIDSPETPGGCWVGFATDGLHRSRSDHRPAVRLEPPLRRGQEVDLDWEAGRQDGCDYRAVRVTPLPHRLSVRLMAEHLTDWPLWDDEGETERRDWPELPAELADRLEAWLANWAGHDLSTLPSPEERRGHLTEGLRLGEELALELGPRYEVTVVP